MQKFFICSHCGNLVGLIDNHGIPMMCCGAKMTELVPNTAEAATEKHLPVVTATECCGGNCCGGIRVSVGSVPHPMTDAHFIGFVYVETEHGGQRRALPPDAEPVLDFCCCKDKPVAVYAYCNLHGLWKTQV
ncbi:MAG: desulfoferrodoxin [Firmicutes bacterium]|nr:desulfoferrodoxin [Bacillota bacterium]